MSGLFNAAALAAVLLAASVAAHQTPPARAVMGAAGEVTHGGTLAQAQAPASLGLSPEKPAQDKAGAREYEALVRGPGVLAEVHGPAGAESPEDAAPPSAAKVSPRASPRSSPLAPDSLAQEKAGAESSSSSTSASSTAAASSTATTTAAATTAAATTKKPEEKKKKSCFPRSAMLAVPGGSELSVAAARPGDKVLSPGAGGAGAVVADTFLADAHARYPERRETSRHRFLELSHACRPGRPLRVTAGHLLYVADAARPGDAPRLLPAASVRAGADALLSLGCGAAAGLALGPSRVLTVSEVWAEGLYNPLTSSGTAIVDGVATSNLVLPSRAIAEAWGAHPWIAEAVGSALLFPLRGLASLGLPYEWLYQAESVHAAAVSALDVMSGLLLAARPGPAAAEPEAVVV